MQSDNPAEPLKQGTEPAAAEPAEAVEAVEVVVPRDAAYWAVGVRTLEVGAVPEGALNLNVAGRRVTGPVQGFGKLWQKTYRIDLSDAGVTPAEVIKTWKENFQSFWPARNWFYGPLTGIAPGEVALLNLSMPGRMKLSTGVLVLYADEESFTFFHGDPANTVAAEEIVNLQGVIWLHVSDLEAIIEKIRPETKRPPNAQIHPNNGAGTLIGKFIYNTVTTLFVGEKIMIQMPTWFFPAGAGPYSEAASFTTHGEPSPTATFRFAEPVFIDRQQNFRVEIEVPDADVLKDIQRIYGPLYIWVVLDGYMTRDVQ